MSKLRQLEVKYFLQSHGTCKLCGLDLNISKAWNLQVVEFGFEANHRLLLLLKTTTSHTKCVEKKGAYN